MSFELIVLMLITPLSAIAGRLFHKLWMAKKNVARVNQSSNQLNQFYIAIANCQRV